MTDAVTEKVGDSALQAALATLSMDPSTWERFIEALGVFDGEAPASTDFIRPVQQQEPGYILFSSAWTVLGGDDGGMRRLRGMICDPTPGASFVPFDPVNVEAFEVARQTLRRGAPTAVVRFHQLDERPLFALLVKSEALPSHWRAGRSGAKGKAAAALILPPLDEAAALWSTVRESFRLTLAEMRLAKLLKAGRSLKRAAEELDVSVNTVRFQLKAIFEKVGVSRQADLILALTEMARVTASLNFMPPPAAEISGYAYPAPPHRFFFTADGRRVAYREYGDPDGVAGMLFHEGLGSSLAVDGADDLAKSLGMRLIIPDRPGFGLSDPTASYSFAGVAEETAALIRSLGLKQVRLLGILSGAPFALATASTLGDEARSVLLLSGRPPTRSRPGGAVNPMRLFREQVMGHPWMFRQLLESMRLRVDSAFIARALRRSASAPADRAHIEGRPDLVAYGLATYREALAISGRGCADEIRCFDGSQVVAMPAAPIRVWHGTDDAIAPIGDLLGYLGDRADEVRRFEGSGHLLALTHWREALTELAT